MKIRKISWQEILMRIGIWITNRMTAEHGMKLSAFYLGGLISNYPKKKKWKLREGIIKMIDDATGLDGGKKGKVAKRSIGGNKSQ